MKNKFIKSSFILLIGEIFTKLIGIIYLIPLYKISPDLGTIMANLFVPYGFILIFAAIGINNIMASEVTKYYKKNEKRLKLSLHNGLSFVIISGIIATVFLFFGAELLVDFISPKDPYKEQLVDGMKILSLAVVLFAITNYMRAVLMGFGKFKIVSLSYFSEQVIRIILILIGVYYFYIVKQLGLESTIYVFAYATVISILSTLILFLYSFSKLKYTKYFLSTKYFFSKKKLLFITISGLIFFINGLYITAFDQIDILMMFPFLDGKGLDLNKIMDIKGIYFNWSLKLIMIPIGLSTAFVSAMIQNYHTSKNPKADVLKILKLVYMYSLISTSVFIIFGTQVYTLIYANDSLGINILKVQAILIGFYVMRTMISVYLVIAGRKLKVFKNSILLLILKPIFNLLLIFLLGNLLGIYTFVLSSALSILVATIILIAQNKSLFVTPEIKISDFRTVTFKVTLIIIISVLIEKFAQQKMYQINFIVTITVILVYAVLTILFFQKDILEMITLKKKKKV